MHYKIAQLIQRGAEKKGSTTTEVYIAQPDFEKENLAGKLFFLIEIESKSISDLKLLNFIIQDLEHNFYQNEKLILREKNQAIKIEHVFELAIAKTNKNLVDFIRDEKIKTDLTAINAIVGVVHENDLFFSNIGKTRAFLIYKDSQTPKQPLKKNVIVPEKKYKIANVIEQTNANDNNIVNPAKLFSNIINGSIPVGGYFVFTNEAVSEYLTNKQMIDITTTLPPIGAVGQIKNLLSQVNSYVSFLGIIIKNTYGTYDLEPRKEIASASTHASISSLNSVEETTEKIMSPGGYINFKKLFGNFKNKGQSIVPANGLKEKIFFKRKPSFIVGQVFSNIKLVFLYLINIFVVIFQFLSNKEKMLSIFKNIKAFPGSVIQKVKSFIFNIRFWFKNLSKLNKIIFGVTLGCLAVLIFNITFINIKNKKQAQQKTLDSIVQQIQQKENQIDANMLYNNEDEIKLLLADIKDLLNKLPQDQKDYASLLDKYNQGLEKIRHAVKPNLAEAASLPQAANNLILADTKIYAANSNTIFSLNLADNKVSSNPVDAANLEQPAFDKSGNLYYFDNQKEIVFNTKTQRAETNAINTQLANLKSSANFNSKLYIIDGNDIFSLAKKNGGIERTKWLKEYADLNNAVSMDIDGSVYVLKADGQILKFLKGKAQGFELDNIEPAISNPTKIMASADNNFIYIAEPSQKRLAVFDKNGKFIMQYVLDAGFQDVVVNEKTKTIYFLISNSIFKADTKHLK